MQIDIALLAVITPLVVALLQAAKAIPWIRDNTGVQPFIAIALGMGICAAAGLAEWTSMPGMPQAVGWTILHGIVTGLTACGLYSGAKAAVDQARETG